MSGVVHSALVNPNSKDQEGGNETLGQGQSAGSARHKNYKGFVAGIFSGISKLSGRIKAHSDNGRVLLTARIVGHPFDTIKVRLQTSEKTQFKGPLDCLLQTVRNEGLRGLYKGATPPLVGWMFMDSMYALTRPILCRS